MRDVVLSVLASTLLLCRIAGGSEPADEGAMKALRTFAQKQLSGSLVKISKPYKYERDGVLSYSFGSVSAEAQLAINLQLWAELLRKDSFFEEKRTSSMIAELEAIVGRCLTVQGQIDREYARRPDPKEPTKEEDRLGDQLRAMEREFKETLKKHLMDYAELNRLDLTIGDAFGDGDYLYIDGKRKQRREVSYDAMVKAVAAQFDRDRVAFVRPFTVFERDIELRDRDIVRFEPGTARGLEDSHLPVANLFRLELLRRYPNFDEAVFKKHLGRMEAELKKEYEEQRTLSLDEALRRWKYSFEQSMSPLREEAAKAKGMALPPPIAPTALGDPYVTIELADDVAEVVFALALDVRFANNDISKAAGKKRVTNETGLSLKPGIYMYQLVLKAGGVRPSVEFEIPRQITKGGKLPLK